MRTYKEKINEIKNLLNNLDADELIDAYNDYCLYKHNSKGAIYYMEEFNNIFEDYTPLQLINLVTTDFHHYDEYFYIDCNEIVSFNDVFDIIDTGELATYIIDEDECLNNRYIEVLLEEYEEEEEKER